MYVNRRLCAKELQNLIYDPKPEDVTRAKQALKSSLLLHSESSTSAAAEEIGRQLLTYGRRIPRAELFARIDAVTPDTVKATAWKYIRDECPAIAAIGIAPEHQDGSAAPSISASGHARGTSYASTSAPFRCCSSVISRSSDGATRHSGTSAKHIAN